MIIGYIFVLIIAAFVSLSSISSGLYILGILVGLHSVSLYVFNFVSLEISTIAALIIFSVWLIKMMAVGEFRYLKTPLDKYLYLMILIMIISALQGINLNISIRGIGSIILNNLLFYYLITSNIRCYKDFDKVFNGMMIGVSIVVSYSIYQIIGGYLGHNLTIPFLEVSNNPFASSGIAYYSEIINGEVQNVFSRPRATLGSSNIVAGYLLVPLMVLINLVYHYKNSTKYKYFYLLSMLIILMVHLHTFSRAGLGGLFVSSVIMFYLYKKEINIIKIFKTIFIIAAIILVITILFSFPFKSVLGRIFEPSGVFIDTGDKHNFTSSTYAHKILAENAISMFNENPIFGVGYNNFGIAFARRFDPEMDYMVAHSHFLNLISTSGLAGFTICTIIYIIIIIYSINSIRLSKQTVYRNIHIGFLSGYAGILISNIVGEYYNYQFVWFYTAMLMSLNLLARMELRKQEL